jgi:hypothetical protein
VKIILSGGDFGGEEREVADDAVEHREVTETQVYVYRVDRPKRGPAAGTLSAVEERD